jgi:O-antigen/teichoic acid export membrane protein
MDKAMDMGRISATGGYHLFMGKMASTAILFVGTMVLTVLIPLESEYGLYTIALIPISMLLLFQDWGISAALVRNCAQCRAANDQTNLRKTINASLIFAVSTGLILTIISLLTANFISTTIFNEPNAAFLISLGSATIFSTSVFTVAQSVFIGFERMKLVSLALVCQAIAQSAIGPLLVYFGYGAFGALMGYTAGSITAGVISILLLYFTILRKLDKVPASRSDIIEALKPLLKYGIPLSIGVILGGILTQFNSFMMASYVKDLAIIGNYRVATNFAVPLTFFAAPISTVLFPAFSKLNPQKELQLLRTVFSSAIKYTTLLMVPATMALMVLSKPLISTLYGSKWSSAPPFLVLSILTNLLVIFGSIGVTGLLNAAGDTKTVMKMYMVTIAFGIPLAFILIPSWGINGMIIGSLVAGIPSIFAGLYMVWKKYGTKIDFKASVRIVAASLLATTTVYLILNLFVAAYWLELLLGLIIFLVIFLISAPLIGAINQSDINNLRGMISGLGVISKTMEIPLALIQKILNARSNSKKLFLNHAQSASS